MAKKNYKLHNKVKVLIDEFYKFKLGKQGQRKREAFIDTIYYSIIEDAAVLSSRFKSKGSAEINASEIKQVKESVRGTIESVFNGMDGLKGYKKGKEEQEIVDKISPFIIRMAQNKYRRMTAANSSYKVSKGLENIINPNEVKLVGYDNNNRDGSFLYQPPEQGLIKEVSLWTHESMPMNVAFISNPVRIYTKNITIEFSSEEDSLLTVAYLKKFFLSENFYKKDHAINKDPTKITIQLNKEVLDTYKNVKPYSSITHISPKKLLNIVGDFMKNYNFAFNLSDKEITGIDKVYDELGPGTGWER